MQVLQVKEENMPKLPRGRRSKHWVFIKPDVTDVALVDSPRIRYLIVARGKGATMIGYICFHNIQYSTAAKILFAGSRVMVNPVTAKEAIEHMQSSSDWKETGKPPTYHSERLKKFWNGMYGTEVKKSWTNLGPEDFTYNNNN